MPMLNVAACVPCTAVEGPGRRFALWVQGCTLRCPGCCNPHMFALAPRTLLDSAVVAEQALAAQAGHGIEGVTFLGGEPMLQARGLADVARRIGPAGLSVMVFSGYTLEQLQAGTLPGAAELLAQADLFVDGPFDATRPDPRRNWIGSVNQRIHFLTDRYAPGIEYEPRFGRAMEIRVTKQGAVHINGWPEPFPHRAGRL